MSWFNICLSGSPQALYFCNMKNIHIQKTFCNLIGSRDFLPFASTCVRSWFFYLVRVAHLFIFYVVLLFVFTFWASCCDVHYDFHIKTMFGLFCFFNSSLFVYSSVQHVVWFISSCVIYIASFSGLSFLIVTSVFSNVYSLMFKCHCFLKTDRVKPATIKLVFVVSLLKSG